MATRDLKHLHPTLVSAFNHSVETFKQQYPELPQPFLTDVYRSPDEQNTLYAKGRTTAGPRVSNAKAGESAHNFMPSFAFDVAFKNIKGKVDYSPHLFDKFAAILLRKWPVGITWGGNFRSLPDKPHFELTNWKSLLNKPAVVTVSYKLTSPYMEGENVKRIQKALGITIDGQFGPKTATAVRNYQKLNKMKIDGVVGPKTAAKLGIKFN